MASSRRRLHVALRLRANEEDASKFGTQASCTSPCVSFAPPNEARLQDVSIASGGLVRSFFVDSFLPATVHNHQVFEQLCRPSIDACADAAIPDTLCFLAYGHTNSGKTHTIAGGASSVSPSGVVVDGEQGILSLCALHLLDRYGQLDVTMLEVYAESVYDMLARGQQRRVRRVSTSSSAAGRTGGPTVVVENLTSRRIRSVAEWNAAADCGWSFRKSSPMDLNARSSRSHAIFTLKAPSGVNVCLIDLAGSERQSIFSKQLNRESITINKSLSRLSTVIRALGGMQSKSKKQNMALDRGGAGYVNFRDTTLTVLLQRYLTGSSLTTIIACVHPHVFFLSETLSTLRYTSRLHNITTEGVPAPRSGSRQSSLDSLGSDGSVLVGQLQAELAVLKQQLADASVSSSIRDKEHTTKIESLESAHRRLAAQLEAAMMRGDATTIELELSSQSTRSISSSAANRRQQQQPLWLGRGSHDTKRVAGWLLSRCVSSMPQFNVVFDDYFHEVLPPNITSIGYVTCMACLLPRDDTDTSVRLGVLDAGDLVMALTMLDAGIPPFVNLHEANCRSAQWWESFELGNGAKVYALAMFDVSTAQIDSICETPADAQQQEDGALSSLNASSTDGSVVGSAAACCTQFSSFDALVPFAVVFAVDAVAPLAHHQAVYDHLATLHMHQSSVEQDVGVFGYNQDAPNRLLSHESAVDACINEPLAEWAAAASPQRSPEAKSVSHRGTSPTGSSMHRASSSPSNPQHDPPSASPPHPMAERSVLDLLLEQIYATGVAQTQKECGQNVVDWTDGPQNDEDAAEVSALTDTPGGLDFGPMSTQGPHTFAAPPAAPLDVADIAMCELPEPDVSSAPRCGTSVTRPIDSWMEDDAMASTSANATETKAMAPASIAPLPPVIRRVEHSDSRLSYASESPGHHSRRALTPCNATQNVSASPDDVSPHWMEDLDSPLDHAGASCQDGHAGVAYTPIAYRAASSSADDGSGTRSRSRDVCSSIGPSISRGTSPTPCLGASECSKQHQCDDVPSTPPTQSTAAAPRPLIVHDITPIGPERSHAMWRAKKKRESRLASVETTQLEEEGDRRPTVCQACSVM